MRLRWFAILVCVLLIASQSMAIENLGGASKRKITRGPDTGSSDGTVTCRTVYYYTCTNQSCVYNTGAGACCGDCRTSDGGHSPCNSCVAN